MKYAFMSFSTPAMTLAEMLDVAKQYGYDGIEPRMDAGHGHGIELSASAEERAAARRQAEASGIALACLATSLRYADPGQSEAAVRDTHERIDLAGDCGIPAMRVFGGQMPEGVSREEAIDVVASSLRAAADHAAERGVTICLETHDAWTNPAHIAAVMRQVNHPAIAVNWDIMHPVRQSDVTIEDSFRILEPWIRHLHIHDGTLGELQLLPIGEGAIDHRRAVELLLSINYQGYISGEWIGWSDPYDLHLPRELATVKQYEAETMGAR